MSWTGIGSLSRVTAALFVVVSFASACSTPPTRDAKAEESVVRASILPTPSFARFVPGQRDDGEGVVIADIAEKAVGSVVNISTEKVVKRARGGGPMQDPFFRRFFGDRVPQMPRERREQSLGSGVIVGDDGLILTNNHVIEGATKVRVTLSDGREVGATIVGTDPETDVGVLKLDKPVDGVRTMPFGDAKSLRLGDLVLAVGNPFGVGQTVTMGIVSAKGRANVGIVDYEDFIQTDAAINPGNSGGALVNTRGELVGINTAILSRSGGYQGIGFAIPSNMAKRIMDSLVKDGRVSRGWLGVAIQNVDRELATALELGVEQGVLVSGVGEDSPAARGGLQRDDVIVAVDGERVASTGALRNAIANAGAKATVTLDIVRDGKSKSLKLELGEKPGDGASAASGGSEATERSAGLTLAKLDGELRRRFRLSSQIEDGVIVVGVESGSRAARAGFRPGDVIREVARKEVKSPEDVRAALRTDESTPVLVQRGSFSQYLALPAAE